MLRTLAGTLVLLWALTAAAEDAAIGRLTAAQGQVFLRLAGGEEAAAKSGVSLASGTILRTGNDGVAEVTFTDGSQLKLQRSSSAQLSPLKRQKKKTSVLLFFGRLWSKVSPSQDGGTSYEVSTPNAVCGVRGTQFETSVGDDGSMRMQVNEGKVAVEGEGKEQLAAPGEQVEANEEGVGASGASQGAPEHDAWNRQKRERLRTDGEKIVKSIKGKIMDRKDKLEALRAQQQGIESKRKAAEQRARSGDSEAVSELKKLNAELAQLADQIADLGDEAQAQFGLVDHFADLADDPRFKMVGRKMIEAEAASLRRVKANLDKLVAEGTDVSIQAMDKMLDDMGKGKGSLREKGGSAGDDLFGSDSMDMH